MLRYALELCFSLVSCELSLVGCHMMIVGAACLPSLYAFTSMRACDATAVSVPLCISIFLLRQLHRAKRNAFFFFVCNHFEN